MMNKNVSDFVAATMDAVLKSDRHKSLFGTTYKFAADMCDKCHKIECTCDASSADDSDDDTTTSIEDTASAFDGTVVNDTNHVYDEEDDSCEANDEEMLSSAFDVAIDSLLTASAALDKVGLPRGSSFSLKLASLVVEAKKKEDSKKKDSKKSSKDSRKKNSKKTDSNDARNKKKDSKPSSSKSTSSNKGSKSTSSKDSKSTKKTNPFAKKSK